MRELIILGYLDSRRRWNMAASCDDDDVAAPLKRQRTSHSSNNSNVNAHDGCVHYALASATYAQRLREKTAAAAHKQQQQLLEIEQLAHVRVLIRAATA